MSEFLKDIKNYYSIVEEIQNKLNESIEFKNISFDYLSMHLYANFEKDLNCIIKNKIAKKNNFTKNYINFLLKSDKNLHRGLGKEKFKNFIKLIFNIEINTKIDNFDWDLFTKFITFRHTLAHGAGAYQKNKEELINNIKDYKVLIGIFEKILIELNKIKKIKKIKMN
ncbi:MAG: hypothetical protein M0R46_11370 [Candidatus Muirbacterium halophilum]|nr:hypothetical protein [Candidatus Muirbacterium halophilum]MCK9476513.1 hypothetical protein [Candidatus Muirbacterium halophilum]